MSVKLPHGAVSSAGIKDRAIREAIMKLSENIKALQAAIEQLKRKAGK